MDIEKLSRVCACAYHFAKEYGHGWTHSPIFENVSGIDSAIEIFRDGFFEHGIIPFLEKINESAVPENWDLGFQTLDISVPNGVYRHETMSGRTRIMITLDRIDVTISRPQGVALRYDYEFKRQHWERPAVFRKYTYGDEVPAEARHYDAALKALSAATGGKVTDISASERWLGR